MKQRYSDVVRKNKIDFIFRPHGKVIYLAISHIIYVVLITYCMITYPDNAVIPICSTLLYTVVATLKIKHNARILHYTEFQNTLFANALKKTSLLFFIVDQNGSVIYRDERSKLYFNNISDLAREIGRINKQEILTALQNGSSYTITLNQASELINEPNVHLTLVPLNRPNGYFLLKFARLKREEIFTEIMEEHCVGSYIVNSDGLLTYGNKSFLSYIEASNLAQPIYLPNLKKTHSGVQINTVLNNMITAYITTKLVIGTNGEERVYGLLNPQNFERSEFLDAPIAIAQFDKDGTVVKSNTAFTELMPPNCSQFTEITKDEINFQLYFARANDSVIYSTLKLWSDQHVELCLKKSAHTITGYFFNITKYKKIEEQLIHSQKVYSIGELAGGIAHDFNNILTAIIGFCDLILTRYNSQDRIFVDIMQIRQNAERATNLVRQLLAFSRRQTLELEVLDITHLIEGIIPLISRLISENVKLIINYDDNIGNIKADKGQLEQVIMNLAINARDAIVDTGSFTINVGEITIRHSEIEDMEPADSLDVITPGQYIELRCIDTGSGIPPDMISKIFLPFFSTKKEEEGTGLGLSTVYGIIRQIGGYIYIKSIINQGTEIRIFLPKAYEKITNNINYDYGERVDIPHGNDCTKNILLVEDEEAVRIFTKKALSREGYNVFDYASSKEALASFHQHKIDIVITDVIMPEMSGVEMINDMKTKADYNMQIIFISGYSEQKLDIVDYNYHFLQKPFSLEKLINKVRNLSKY